MSIQDEEYYWNNDNSNTVIILSLCTIAVSIFIYHIGIKNMLLGVFLLIYSVLCVDILIRETRAKIQGKKKYIKINSDGIEYDFIKKRAKGKILWKKIVMVEYYHSTAHSIKQSVINIYLKEEKNLKVRLDIFPALATREVFYEIVKRWKPEKAEEIAKKLEEDICIQI